MEPRIEDAVPEECLVILKEHGVDPDLIARLLDVHSELWFLEDRARSRRATDGEIADVKRAIDRANGRRHDLIAAIDRPLLARESPGATTLFSETPGELCDRLVILTLKILNAGRNRDAEDLPVEVRRSCEDKARRFELWRSFLRACMGRELLALGAGEALLPPRSEYKMYNDPLLNPVTRAE